MDTILWFAVCESANCSGGGLEGIEAMETNEVRTVGDARGQLDWVGDLPAEGVGGRQATARVPGGGGAYLDECTIPDVWERAKIRELADMGLPRLWLKIAVAIGYDDFMAMWRILDAEPEAWTECESMLRPYLRRFDSFRRFQRNRFVEALTAQGLSHDEIIHVVADELGENLSVRHIKRLAERGRVAP